MDVNLGQARVFSELEKGEKVTDRAVRAVLGNDAHKMKSPMLPLGFIHDAEEGLIAEKTPVLDSLVDPDAIEKDAATRP
jgi:hypothetical protein